MSDVSVKIVALVWLMGLAGPAVAAPSLTAATDPLSCNDPEFGENTYQLFVYQSTVDKHWTAAKTFAEQQSDGNVSGHLATITSQAENDCIAELFNNIAPVPGEAWLGGFQTECMPLQANCGWSWINEGTFGPQQSGVPDNAYVNFSPGEPNDANGGEQHLAIFLNRDETWNDEAALGNIRALLVEYDHTVPAQSCFGVPDPQDPQEIEGCNPSGVQNIQIPEVNNLQAGDRIAEFLVEPTSATDPICASPNAFRDPRVDEFGFPMDIRQLDVFGEFGRPAGVPADADLVLDEFTYGRPCFAVVFGSTNFALSERYPDGVVITRLQQPELLDIGPVGQCYDEVNFPDLQKVSQFTYQTDDRFEMIEETAAAMTERCFNPSRASTFKFSFGVLNTAEHCGIDYSAPGGPAAVASCFRGLAVAKFDALEQLLFEASGTLNKPKFSTLSSKLNQARSMINTGQWSKADKRLRELLALVVSADFQTTPANYPGHLIMRIDNLLYRIDLQRRAEANPP